MKIIRRDGGQVKYAELKRSLNPHAARNTLRLSSSTADEQRFPARAMQYETDLRC